MKRFTKYSIHLRLAWALSVMLCLALTGCSRQEAPSTLRPSPEPQTKVLTTAPQQTVVAYFLDAQGKNLLPLTMETNETREVPFVALQKLLAGAPNDFVQSPLPTGIKAIDLYLEKEIIYVDLTAEFLQTAPAQVANSLRCIVATVGWASPQGLVNILVEGEPVEEIGGKKISQPLSYGAINPVGAAENTAERTVQVYYGDEQAMYLVPISYSCAGQGEEAYSFVMKKLIEGPPKNMGLQRTMYGNTRLNGVAAEKDMVTIDLSREAVAYGGGTAFEYLFVQSVLATFAQFPEIKQVKLLIDGAPYDLLPEGTDISMPLGVNRTVNHILNQK